MKIMLQNHTFFPILGGIENYLYYVSKTLKKMGHEPTILCEKHDPRLSTFETYEGIRIIRHPYYNVPKHLLFKKPTVVSQQLSCFIADYVEDINLVLSRYPHYCFATISLDLNIPIFYIPPSVYWKQLNQSSRKLSLKARCFNFAWKKSLNHIEKMSILKSHKTIVFSQNMAECLRRYYGLKGPPHILPPGVDLPRFSGVRDSGLLEELQISQGSRILLYVGRLSPEKNVERLMREFGLMRRRDVVLLIVGYGSDRERLEKLKATIEGGERIRFLGPRTDVERFYSIADVFISPSRHEPFGQVILEAMAAGLPCIGFKRVWPEYEVAAEEMIANGVNGYCVDPYDRDELRERLLYLIENPDVGKRMGETGRKICEKNFRWDDHVRKLLGLVDQGSDSREGLEESYGSGGETDVRV
jgi:glycosyltransferase involved in cell wall biosynthesis